MADAPCFLQEARERIAVHVVEDDEELSVERLDVERLDHVRVVNPRGEPGLVEEHRDELGVFRELRVQLLDGHGACEAHGAV